MAARTSWAPGSSADSAKAARPRAFPAQIQRALVIACASSQQELQGLSPAARMLLVQLLRSTSAADPRLAVRVSNEHLAGSLGLSVRSIVNFKALLVDGGWITRSQVRSRRRGMQISEVWWTDFALDVLALLEPLDATDAAGRADPAHAYLAFVEQPLQGIPPARQEAVDKLTAERTTLSAGTASCEPTAPAGNVRPSRPANARVHEAPNKGAIWLPAELGWLGQLMSPAKVCWLMREARIRGARLQDLAERSAPQLRRANDAFAYLRSLVTGGGRRPVAPQAAGATVADAKPRASLHSGALSGLAGRAFVAGDGLVRRVHAGAVWLFTPEEAAKPLGRHLGTRPITPAFLAALAAGNLRPWPFPDEPAAHAAYA